MIVFLEAGAIYLGCIPSPPSLMDDVDGEMAQISRKRLGFRLDFAHRGDEAKADPCYMGIERDGIWLNLSSFPGDGVSGGVVNLLVENVDALHAEFVAKGVSTDLEPMDQTWGTREMYVKDADGNCHRFMK